MVSTRTAISAASRARGEAKTKAAKSRPLREVIRGACLCGGVTIETEAPVFWAWHDHTAPTRKAHGAAYATYVGVWRSRTRLTGEVCRFEDTARGAVRSFCPRCGSPVMFERRRDRAMVNLPRALFDGRTGREPKYHLGIDELRDWAYLGAPVGPLKGYPGVTVERARRRKPSASLFAPDAEA